MFIVLSHFRDNPRESFQYFYSEKGFPNITHGYLLKYSKECTLETFHAMKRKIRRIKRRGDSTADIEVRKSWESNLP